MTNFDKLKSMSIDDFTAWLKSNKYCEQFCVYEGVDCCDERDCFTGIKQWLEKENK